LAIAFFMEAAEKAGHVMLPLAWGGAMPGGKVTSDAFERMAQMMVEGLRREPPDAIFLELHGAMVAERFDDGEGELLRRVRETVGPDVPILISLDLHANVSPEMVAAADFIPTSRSTWAFRRPTSATSGRASRPTARTRRALTPPRTGSSRPCSRPSRASRRTGRSRPWRRSRGRCASPAPPHGRWCSPTRRTI